MYTCVYILFKAGVNHIQGRTALFIDRTNYIQCQKVSKLHIRKLKAHNIARLASHQNL